MSLVSSDKLTFKKQIEDNRNQTRMILEQRLKVVESDIFSLNDVVYDAICCGDLRELHNTLHKDKEVLEKALSKLGE